MRIRFFPVIVYNPDTEQLRRWYREQRGTPEFRAALASELVWRASRKPDRG